MVPDESAEAKTDSKDCRSLGVGILCLQSAR